MDKSNILEEGKDVGNDGILENTHPLKQIHERGDKNWIIINFLMKGSYSTSW